MNILRKVVIGTVIFYIFVGSSSSIGACEGGGGGIVKGVGIAGSTIGILGVGLYDISTAGESARRYNEKHRSWAVVPVLNTRAHRVELNMAYNFGLGHSSIASQNQTEGHQYEKPNTPEHYKSPETATVSSWAGTLIPSALGLLVMASSTSNEEIAWGGVMLSGGMIFGPSTGHWYAGQIIRGWTTVGIRMGLAGFVVREIQNDAGDCLTIPP